VSGVKRYASIENCGDMVAATDYDALVLERDRYRDGLRDIANCKYIDEAKQLAAAALGDAPK
jgi:hypothetical protein